MVTIDDYQRKRDSGACGDGSTKARGAAGVHDADVFDAVHILQDLHDLVDLREGFFARQALRGRDIHLDIVRGHLREIDDADPEHDDDHHDQQDQCDADRG
ncbi:MAG: hypothetical protein IJI88_05630, partial [Atopobiaceae bacterium]|nr:hypothetical protein [Atopobiaceae bacterium]